MSLFLPTYFSPISQYSAIVKSDEITFEIQDNFQKQTYRNRCYIYGTNGKQLLNIPVKHTKESKKTKETLIETNYPWQSQHLKSIQTAYLNSPFFEFYRDELDLIFTKKYKFLLDVNIDTFLFFMDALQLPNNHSKTVKFTDTESENDCRFLANAKQNLVVKSDEYVQMFDDKHGFIPDLSMLDLLFMEGTNAITFLNKS